MIFKVIQKNKEILTLLKKIYLIFITVTPKKKKNPVQKCNFNNLCPLLKCA